MKKILKYLFVSLFILIIIFFGNLYFNVQKDLKNNYFSKKLAKNKEILEQINIISKSLHNKKYGLTGGHWGELLAHTFYGYSLTNLYLNDKNNLKFKKFVKNELEFILNYIENDGKQKFINKKTDIPLGIIYQGHKNQILACLVLIGEKKYEEKLYKNSDFLYEFLEKNKSKNCETYKGKSWYVDNINAIYSLYLTDKIRKKNNLKPKYKELIKSWINYMKKNVGKNGMILAEITGPKLQFNQARGAALSWSLIYLYDLDRKLFFEQFELYKKYFFDDNGLSYDVPKGQKIINKVPAGPVIFGYSSSASILALGIWKKVEDEKNFYKNLKIIDYIYFFDGEKYIFGKSVLINSLVLWGKTQVYNEY